jgi:hypothetical protein
MTTPQCNSLGQPPRSPAAGPIPGGDGTVVTDAERPSIIGTCTINHMGHGIAVTEAHSSGTRKNRRRGRVLR